MKEKLTIALLKEAKDGNMGSNEVYTMTRSEAIERMAKSLFKVDNVLALDIKWSQLKKIKQLAYKELAEAALNSLLEVHDDER